MYSLIVFLPLLGCILAGLFSRVLGEKMSQVIPTTLLIIAAALSWVAFFQVAGGFSGKVQIMPWIVSGDLAVDWTIRVDMLTAVMLVVVNTVSSLVHLYSIGYMAEDPHKPRFFSYLSLFTFAMLMLITSDNFLQMFFGWEGVGLASYLLIGFWYKKPSACAAAMKAFIVNRIGDFGFALGVVGIFAVFHSIDFDTVFAQSALMSQKQFTFLGMEGDIMEVLTLLLFIGAMGKSAQLFLHTWLPDAMEGPTPVSALIHAATMVTAGVFLVARCSPMFQYAPGTLTFVTIIGASTAFFAATVGLVQNDIKRVIAYSTCSQLGYMFFAAGVGAYQAAIFHLFTHAFFKALLFLSAGSVINAMHHEQDMRKMGGLARKIPWTYCAMLVGTLALTGVGIPGFIGFAGFYSKDAIIEAAFNAHGSAAGYAFVMGVVAALMTAFYSWRLIFMTFHGRTRADHHAYDHAHESPKSMLIPLAVLSVGAVLAGGVFAHMFVGEGKQAFWHASIFIGSENGGLAEARQVPLWVKLSPFVAMLIGFGLAYLMYIRRPDIPGRLAARHHVLYQFLLNKWYFDEIYDFLFVRPVKALGRFLWKKGDGATIDGAIDGLAMGIIPFFTRMAVRAQSGYVFHYAFAMVIGVSALITWFAITGAGH